nr:putative reverse transcriptase domain-containing protein [Tanacetum cinerariifolium]
MFSQIGKLNPSYIAPFKILARVGTIAYRLELPEQLSRVYSTFYVSKLKKCTADERLAIPLDEIQVDEKLNFIEEPSEIIDHEVKCLKQIRISIVKVQWNNKRGHEFIWGREDQMQKNELSISNLIPADRVLAYLHNWNATLHQMLDLTVHDLDKFFDEVQFVVNLDLVQRYSKSEGSTFPVCQNVSPLSMMYFQHDLIFYLKLKGFPSYVDIALLTITGGLDTALDLNDLLSRLVDDL